MIPTARKRPLKPLPLTYRIVSIGGDNAFAILTEGEPMTLRHERSQEVLSIETAEVESFLRRGVWRLEVQQRQGHVLDVAKYEALISLARRGPMRLRT